MTQFFVTTSTSCSWSHFLSDIYIAVKRLKEVKAAIAIKQKLFCVLQIKCIPDISLAASLNSAGDWCSKGLPT
jgi:hypothetical protein